MEGERVPDYARLCFHREVSASVGVEDGNRPSAGLGIHLEPLCRLGSESDTAGTISEEFAGVAVFWSRVHSFFF